MDLNLLPKETEAERREREEREQYDRDCYRNGLNYEERDDDENSY